MCVEFNGEKKERFLLALIFGRKWTWVSDLERDVPGMVSKSNFSILYTP